MSRVRACDSMSRSSTARAGDEVKGNTEDMCSISGVLCTAGACPLADGKLEVSEVIRRLMPLAQWQLQQEQEFHGGM
jgi:hypothetical protein